MRTIVKHILLTILLLSIGNTFLICQVTHHGKLAATKSGSKDLEIVFHIAPLSTSLKTDVFESNTNRKFGFVVGADIVYYFKQNNKIKLGVSGGFGLSQYNSGLKVDYADSVWTTDADQDRILLYEYGSGLNETRKITSLEIPVLFQLKYSISPKIDMVCNIGPRYSVVISDNFSNSMSLTREAYYPDLNVVLHDIDVEGSPFYYPTDKPVEGSGSLNIKSNLGLQIGSGIRCSVSPAVSLNFELKYFAGLTNISKGNSTGIHTFR